MYTIADLTRDGDAGTADVGRGIEESIATLQRGEALLLYPAGRAYRSRAEDLGGNSAVELILHAVPEVRVALARTSGLWGSSFSYARGSVPNVREALWHGFWGVVKSGLLFTPRRHVTIEFCEPQHLPRTAGRSTLNRYLERFYNQDAPPASYVPYSIWERGGVQNLPDPVAPLPERAPVVVPSATRELVLRHLSELSGRSPIEETDRLAHELGLDSLARVELLSWIEHEFGLPQTRRDRLETAADVLLAAAGEAVEGGSVELRRVNQAWLTIARLPPERIRIAEGEQLTEVFLRAARRRPDQVVIADQASGTKTYRDLVTAILILKPILERLPGEYLGIMLPASVAANVAYLATLFAGKTPVMINWTVGPRGVEHGLELLGIRRVLSAERLVQRLQSEGFSKVTKLLERLIYLDRLSSSLSLATKIAAAMRARLTWGELEAVRPRSTAVVLFTSGSESQPKAVPLSHANLLSNVRDLVEVVPLKRTDALLGILPPFHAFGLTVNALAPLLSGMRAVYHPNPAESATLASLIEAYGATALVGTPTFLGGVCRAARRGQLRSLRLVITGAEKCPAHVYDALAECCPSATVLEGYGITECSPVVSVNRPGRPRRETIGEVLPSVEATIVDPETMVPVPTGERGLLLVRGPSVFGGYLHHDGESPFVDHAGLSWYRTGDLVRQDEHGIISFSGRQKRFVKRGGEIISLPAMEAVLERTFANPALAPDYAPTLAVASSGSEEHVELVLFTTQALQREAVNRALRDAGLSPLHHIWRVLRIDSIPLLGTGKTDYRALEAKLTSA